MKHQLLTLICLCAFATGFQVQNEKMVLPLSEYGKWIVSRLADSGFYLDI